MKVIIVGGVAGGASAAARLRRLDEAAEIILLEKGEHISYANCGLPYYIGGTIADQGDILIQTPASFTARFNVDVRVMHEAVAIDRQNKVVTVKDRRSGAEYRASYDKLILSPGAEPLRPPIKGIESNRVYTLRTVGDAERIKAYIAAEKPRRVIVVGAGYIGLEMAENLHRRGIFVTLVEMAPQVIAPLDTEMAAAVHQHLKTKNVEFYLSEQLAELRESGAGITAVLKSGRELPADFVIMSVGVKPDTKLAAGAGITVGKTGGIQVNPHLQTNDPDIYAVGDAIEFPDPVFGDPKVIPLAGPANKQGRIAATNIVRGNTETYGGTVGTAIAKVFDIAVAVTGLSERALRQKGTDYFTSITHSSSHAGYYPGALPLTIKLNCAKKDGTILGAQVVGYEGVAPACEVLSFACQKRMTVTDIREMDQAYAPPFSSAKSPVNMAGFVAENVLRGVVRTVGWQDVRGAGDTVVLLDVRTAEEEKINRIPGSILIPLNQLRSRLGELPRNKKIYVYCAVGLRGYIAARILAQNGFPSVFNLTGGLKTYELVTGKQSNEDIYGNYRIEKDDDFTARAACDASGGAPPVEINACGLQCPGPIMKLSEAIKTVAPGACLKIRASDPGFIADVRSWCQVTGNRLVNTSDAPGDLYAVIEKGVSRPAAPAAPAAATDKTIIVFNDDFDRALAAFVIANGALAMGRKVTLFFTFWGLNILKKKTAPPVKKDLIARMFSLMLPKGSSRLALSKLNMLGMGPLLMRRIMRAKNIDSLESLMESALRSGARVIACQMSMDVMGIKKEELIDGITVGGVASYIEAAESAGTNLFI